MREIKLIELYCAVCHHYGNTIVAETQRLSNNFCPKFTDEECIATFIWGLSNQKFDVKRCYDFIKDFYGDWFPELPSYQAYSNRICNLAEAFKMLAGILLNGLGLDTSHADFIIDSMPIIVAGSRRSSRATAANELCDKGYCASKGMYYYGIKLHSLAQCNWSSMPTPSLITLSKASENDLSVGKEMLDSVRNIRIFADKCYKNKAWEGLMLTMNNVTILTPVKHKKGQEYMSFSDRLFSSAVSSVRQPIESLFNWIQEKTNIQAASKIRSSSGLIAFVFARIAYACLCFNS